jgi:hypothetical protein
MSSSFSRLKNQTASDVKAAAEADLLELSLKSGKRPNSNPRQLKPIP